MDKRMACCLHPTRVVMIDDRKRFLKTLGGTISKSFPCTTFHDPKEALQFLLHEYKPDPFVTRCMFLQEECRMDEQSIDINVRLIRNEMYNPARFDEVSVIIVDYAMPQLNGIEFCQELREKYSMIKIILLTGEAENELAVQAFNEGLISKFILKSTPNLNHVLLDAITHLQREYAEDLSANVIMGFVNRPELPAGCLRDPKFLHYLDELQEKYHLVERFMVDGNGSCVFLNAVGQPSWLAVASESAMKAWTDMALDNDTPVPTEVIQALRNREKILHLYTDEDLAIDPSEWGSYLHPAVKLEGRAPYYCAYITNPTAYNVQLEKIESYQNYLKRKRAEITEA